MSEYKCDEYVRTFCIYNSFGIVTILYGEILSLYKYLNNTRLSEQDEARACNTLTILHSLVSNPEVASRIIDGISIFSVCLFYRLPLILDMSVD